jgi:hypothetical protein
MRWSAAKTREGLAGAPAAHAAAEVQALALRVLADRLEHDEGPRGPVSVIFETRSRFCDLPAGLG